MAAAPFYVHVKYARQKKICHSERSVSGVEESSHFVYVCSEIGAKILRLRCALHSFAQDDNFFLYPHKLQFIFAATNRADHPMVLVYKQA